MVKMSLLVQLNKLAKVWKVRKLTLYSTSAMFSMIQTLNPIGLLNCKDRIKT